MARRKSVKRSLSQWQQLLAAQQESGLSISAFCQQHSITLSSFYAWKQKLHPAPVSDSSPSPSPSQSPQEDRWLPLELPRVQPQNEPWNIELSLPGNITIKIKSA